MKDHLIEWGIFVVFLMLTMGIGVGWVLNLIAIVNYYEPTHIVVLRIIGVFFFPVGGILGWVD